MGVAYLRGSKFLLICPSKRWKLFTILKQKIDQRESQTKKKLLKSVEIYWSFERETITSMRKECLEKLTHPKTYRRQEKQRKKWLKSSCKWVWKQRQRSMLMGQNIYRVIAGEVLPTHALKALKRLVTWKNNNIKNIHYKFCPVRYIYLNSILNKLTSKQTTAHASTDTHTYTTIKYLFMHTNSVHTLYIYLIEFTHKCRKETHPNIEMHLHTMYTDNTCTYI